ncbi:hypothetical protein ACEU6E_10950 (plasmid) [Halorutilales archaeon Cl-col2-1]
MSQEKFDVDVAPKESLSFREPEKTLGDAKHRLLADHQYRDMGDEEFLEQAEELYADWVTEDTYLVMQQIEKRLNDWTGSRTESVENFGVKASKRGNDVYRARVTERFNEIRKALPNKEFFDKDATRQVQSTRAFFVSLTYDRGRHGLVESWDRVGEDYNRFRSRLQREFADRCSRVGKKGHRIEDCDVCEDRTIRQVRIFEGQQSGYPAPHALIVMDKDIPVMYHEKSDSWRMASYSMSQRVEDCWGRGHADVKAVHTLDGELGQTTEVVEDEHGGKSVAMPDGGRSESGGGAVSYMLKYLRKSLSAVDEGNKTQLRTLVMSWLTDKRAFSASSNWQSVMTLPDSNPQCIIQTDLFGEEVTSVEIKMLGTIAVDSRGDRPPPWRLEFDDLDMDRIDELVSQ